MYSQSTVNTEIHSAWRKADEHRPPTPYMATYHRHGNKKNEKEEEEEEEVEKEEKQNMQTFYWTSCFFSLAVDGV